MIITRVLLIRILMIVGLLAFCGCTKGQGISLAEFENASESPQNFKLCHGFGCSDYTWTGLSEKQWMQAVSPLKRKAKDAEQERMNIAKSIARIEKSVQTVSGVSRDLGGARTFEKDQGQMDCLDETINTSRYLAFIEAEGLLRFHDVYEPIHRGFFVDGMWPHNSAAVREKETGEIYAIDSYYSDNGGEVHVVALDVWLDEWRPEDAP